MPSKQLISGEWVKVCSKADCHMAGIPQPIEGFSKNKRQHDGLVTRCKKCVNLRYTNNRERILAQKAEYGARSDVKARKKAYDTEYRARPEIKTHRKAHQKVYRSQPEIKARKKAYDAKYNAENREHNLARVKAYYAQPEIKERKKAYDAAYSALPEIKARTKARMKEYRSRPAIKARNNHRQRCRKRDDPAYRLKCNVSSRICQALKRRGKTKGGRTFDHLPYTPKGLMEHIENLFDEHMNWDNHGTYWHIDHIRPHASFKYDSLDHPDFQKCWALENLRPLEASENIRKNSFYEGKRHYHSEAV